jgi:hypothetical protein
VSRTWQLLERAVSCGVLPHIVAPKRQEKGNVVAGGLEVVGAGYAGLSAVLRSGYSDAMASLKPAELT